MADLYQSVLNFRQWSNPGKYITENLPFLQFYVKNEDFQRKDEI